MVTKSLSHCYSKFLGSGNINGKYWFIGIEPGGNPLNENQSEYRQHVEEDDNETFIKYLNEPFEDKVEGIVYSLIFRLLTGLELKENYSDKPNKINFYEKGNAFFTNLSPLKFQGLKGIKNKDIIDEIYKPAFSNLQDIKIGISGDFNRQKLFSDESIKNRSLELQKYLKDKVVFILSKSHETFFGKLFNVDFSLLRVIKNIEVGKSDIIIYDNNPTLIRMPQRGWSINSLENCVSFLKKNF